MTTETEKRLWDAADQLRANSRLKSSEYSVPVLGLIFLQVDFVFSEKLHELNEELERLNADAHELEEKIAGNVVTILDGRPNE